MLYSFLVPLFYVVRKATLMSLNAPASAMGPPARTKYWVKKPESSDDAAIGISMEAGDVISDLLVKAAATFDFGNLKPGELCAMGTINGSRQVLSNRQPLETLGQQVLDVLPRTQTPSTAPGTHNSRDSQARGRPSVQPRSTSVRSASREPATRRSVSAHRSTASPVVRSSSASRERSANGSNANAPLSILKGTQKSQPASKDAHPPTEARHRPSAVATRPSTSRSVSKERDHVEAVRAPPCAQFAACWGRPTICSRCGQNIHSHKATRKP